MIKKNEHQRIDSATQSPETGAAILDETGRRPGAKPRPQPSPTAAGRRPSRWPPAQREHFGQRILRQEPALGSDSTIPARPCSPPSRKPSTTRSTLAKEAGILPEILGPRRKTTGANRYKVGVQDNGPGIVKAQIPKIFGQLLYGSKFHRLRMSRRTARHRHQRRRHVRRADHRQAG